MRQDPNGPSAPCSNHRTQGRRVSISWCVSAPAAPGHWAAGGEHGTDRGWKIKETAGGPDGPDNTRKQYTKKLIKRSKLPLPPPHTHTHTTPPTPPPPPPCFLCRHHQWPNFTIKCFRFQVSTFIWNMLLASGQQAAALTRAHVCEHEPSLLQVRTRTYQRRSHVQLPHFPTNAHISEAN